MTSVGHYEIRCSTEGSTGVVLSDLRKVDRPGAWGVAPWAIVWRFLPQSVLLIDVKEVQQGRAVCGRGRGLVLAALEGDLPAIWGLEMCGRRMQELS